MTATIQWSALTAAEMFTLMEHAMARHRGQAAPPPNAAGVVPTTDTWEALGPERRASLIEGMTVELQRAGLTQCFTRAPAAHHQQTRPTLMAVGKTGSSGGAQMGKPTTQELATELAKHKGVAALVNEATGKAHVFMLPTSPWAVNDTRLGELRSRVGALRTKLAAVEARGGTFADRSRLEADLRSAERALRSAEAERVLERQRQRSTMGAR